MRLHNYSFRAEAYYVLYVTATPSIHHHFMFNGLETSPNCHGVCFYYFLVGMQGSLLHIGLSSSGSVHTVINSLTVTSSFYTSCMTLQLFPKKCCFLQIMLRLLILTRAANIFKTAQNIVSHKNAGSLFCPISRILAMFLFFVKWLHMCSNSFDGFALFLRTETLGARVNCLFFF